MRGAILAGGAASRYGGAPKGLVTVAGRRILDRVVDAVQAVTGALPLLIANAPGVGFRVVDAVQAVTGALPLLIANAPGASAWRPDLQTIPDARPGFGSLGGIYTAVTAAPESVLCVAWDMPFVPDALLRALVDGAAAGNYGGFLPDSSGRRGLEPLCAVYGPACGPAIARRLDNGDLKAISFHADVRVGILSLAQVRAFGDPGELFFNVNTPDDLERAEALWQRRA